MTKYIFDPVDYDDCTKCGELTLKEELDENGKCEDCSEEGM